MEAQAAATLRSVDPEPMDSPSSRQYPPASAPPVVFESHIPDHPSSMVDLARANELAKANDFPRADEFSGVNDYPRANDYQRPNEFPTPMQTQTPYASALPLDAYGVKSNCQLNMRELIRLQRLRQGFGIGTSAVDLEWQIRNQAGIFLTDLRLLQGEVRRLVKAAQNHRWRKWLLGGFIATFIPAVRKLFRRGTDTESRSSSNDTEYAFRKSKGLIERIKDTVLGHHHWASIAFFVFAVMHVFQNEVTLRVAKTVQKRIRKLAARVENGDSEIDERDLKLLEGWRWRVILW